MYITKLGSGKSFDLYALVVNEEHQVQEYILSLEDKDQTQVFALFNFILEKGPPHNIQKFRNIGNEIYELKTWRGVRLLSFFGGSSLPRSLILAHGFFKPGNKELARAKKKAVKLRKEFLGSPIIIKDPISEGKP
jgi:phage-related protein